MKYFLVLCLVAAFSCSVARAETLTLVTLNSPPLEYMENGRATGFNVAVCREAMKRMGRDVEILVVPWARALRMVRQGKAHGIIDAVRTEERAGFLHFPEESLRVEEVMFFQRKGEDIELSPDLSDAGRLSVGAGRGYYYGQTMASAVSEGLFKRVEEAPNMETNILKLLSRRIDVFIGVRVPIFHLLNITGARGQVEPVRQTGTSRPLVLDRIKTYVAFSKRATGPELAREVGRVLLEMKRDGTYQRFEHEYYP